MRKRPARFTEKLIAAIIAMGAWMAHPVFASMSDRVIELDGTSNTRDIGGYATGDLRTVRMGQIIRSDKLSRLTDDDFLKLEELGLKTVIDLRTDEEREDSPTLWQGAKPPQIHHVPVLADDSDWYRAQSRMLSRARFTEERSKEHSIEGYRAMADEGMQSYEKVMELVLDESNWPVLIHCSAGKDRSGVAIALIQEALGVDREIIMQEYLLTNEQSRTKAKAAYIAEKNKKASRKRIARSPSADAWFPIVGVLPEMLEGFYAHVDERYGSMDVFLNEIGVDREDRNALADALTLEKQELALGE